MTARGALLGRGKVAEVFEYGDRALKLYLPGGGKEAAFREAHNLARVEALGLPVPAVGAVIEDSGRWGVVMTRVAGDSLAALAMADPARLPAVIETLAALHARIHACPGVGFPTLRERLAANIARAPHLAPDLRARLLQRLAAAETGDRLCHGDFHPLNVLGTLETPVVVDWLDAHCGSPAADLCRTWVLLKPHRPEIAELALAAGLRAEGLDRAEVLGWAPLIAAARLAEGVPDEEPALLEMAAG